MSRGPSNAGKQPESLDDAAGVCNAISFLGGISVSREFQSEAASLALEE